MTHILSQEEIDDLLAQADTVEEFGLDLGGDDSPPDVFSSFGKGKHFRGKNINKSGFDYRYTSPIVKAKYTKNYQIKKLVGKENEI